jgi:hypothetical protein
MHKLMPGYAKAVAEAIRQLETNPALTEVPINNGSGLKLTRDDAHAKARTDKGIKSIGTETHANKTYVVFPR